MVSPTTNQQEELDAYHLAYMHIFRSILSKKGLQADRQKQVLMQIKTFQESKIKNIDAYLDHIPEFAKVLAVKPDQLGAFIGSNLLKALHQVQAQQAQKKKVAAEAAKVVNDPEIKKSILKEIMMTIGTVIEPPDRFSPIDMGLMTLTVKGNLVYPQSKQADPLAATGMNPGPNDGAANAAAQANHQEKSILLEILELPGMDSINHIKYVVPAFPAGQSAEPELDESLSVATDSSTGIEGGSILQEILAIPGFFDQKAEVLKLKSTIPGAGSDPFGNSDETAQSQEVEQWDAIDFSYGEYEAALKKLQAFQAQKDNAGYQSWMQSSEKIRLLMGLRKFDAALAQGKQINIDDEIYNMAQNENSHIDRLKDFYDRIKVYQRLQKLTAVFISKVKLQPKPVLAGFQKIWPQVKLILYEPGDLDSRLQQLKIPMLQIMDPALKQSIMKMMNQLFVKFEEIENS